MVKTEKFKKPKYLGDPRNVVKIFNEKEVDELALLDITATRENRPPRFDLIKEIVTEAFMPVAYGGGIRTIEDARTILSLGVEKIIVNTRGVEDPSFVRAVANELGSQSVVVCLDVKENIFGGYEVRTRCGQKGTGHDPVVLARRMERMGAGELIVQSIDRDGTRKGYDLGLIRKVSDNVSVPVIACGGAGGLEDLRAAAREGGASAVAAGSLFVFQGRHRAVLINYPGYTALKTLFEKG